MVKRDKLGHGTGKETETMRKMSLARYWKNSAIKTQPFLTTAYIGCYVL